MLHYSGRDPAWIATLELLLQAAQPKDFTRLARRGYGNGVPFDMVALGVLDPTPLNGRSVWTCRDCRGPGHASRRTRFCPMSDESLMKLAVAPAEPTQEYLAGDYIWTLEDLLGDES